MSRFTLEGTPIEGLTCVRRHGRADARGGFARLFCAAELAAAGWAGHVEQINLSTTREAGTVRGLHFQRAPHAERKLVSCLLGRVWDVAVDLRRGSPTFLRWHAVELSEANELALLVPEGVAHGFQALDDDSRLLYLHSAAYEPSSEGGLHPADPRLGIAWPRAVRGLSPRDAAHPPLAADFAGIAP